MASGNVSLRCTKQKCSARIEINSSLTINIHSKYLHDIINDHDVQCHILRYNYKRIKLKISPIDH